MTRLYVGWKSHNVGSFGKGKDALYRKWMNSELAQGERVFPGQGNNSVNQHQDQVHWLFNAPRRGCEAICIGTLKPHAQARRACPCYGP